jgi:hypothetical protein
MPRGGLFAPCYLGQLYPQVGVANFGVLRHLGVDVEFPEAPTRGRQPMANSDQQNGWTSEKFVSLNVCSLGSPYKHYFRWWQRQQRSWPELWQMGLRKPGHSADRWL